MPTALIAKLERFTKLAKDDKAAIHRLAAMNVRHLGPHEDLIREGDRPKEINLMLAGWACRHKHLEDGRRQIIAFFLPGLVVLLRGSSSAMHSNARPWLVRKFQVVTMIELLILKWIACN